MGNTVSLNTQWTDQFNLHRAKKGNLFRTKRNIRHQTTREVNEKYMITDWCLQIGSVITDRTPAKKQPSPGPFLPRAANQSSTWDLPKEPCKCTSILRNRLEDCPDRTGSPQDNRRKWTNTFHHFTYKLLLSFSVPMSEVSSPFRKEQTHIPKSRRFYSGNKESGQRPDTGH